MKKLSLFLFVFLSTNMFFGQVSSSVIKANVSSERNIASLNLPFFEDWSSASLETNNWTKECDNWAINSQEGNENPSVEFTWDPQLQNDYSCALVSDIFNGSLFGVGRIMLEFDLRLDNRTATGEEKLFVDVFDGSNWNQVAEYTNDANIEWLSNSIDITDQIIGSDFKIRFNASGQNSFHILSWFVDNISLYRVCEKPYNLNGYLIWEPPANVYVELEWRPPVSTINEEYPLLYWGNSNPEGAAGLVIGGDFSVAAKWNSSQLENYIGDTLKEIRFFLDDLEFEGIIVNIWAGESAENIIYSNNLDQQIVNGWNYHELDTIIIIDGFTNYFIGYSIVGQVAAYYPAGYDQGPAIPGYGDLIYTEANGWGTISESGINNNWLIQMELANNNYLDSVDCIGFNVYQRLVGEDPDYELFGFEPFELHKEHYYFREVYDINSSLCYKVTALWALSTDTCESDFALTLYEIEDRLCIFTASVHSTNSQLSQLNIYPNPFSTSTTISYDLSQPSTVQVAIFNHLGVRVDFIREDQSQGEQQLVWNASGQPPGVYYFRLQAGEKMASGKLLLVK